MDSSHRVPGPDQPVLSWSRSDIEQRLGFRGGRFTRVNSLLTLLIAAALAIIVYAALFYFASETAVGAMFLQRGFTPYVMTLLFAWSLVILFFKWRKLAFQRRALTFRVAPDEHDFVLSANTVDQVLQRMYDLVDDSRCFVLFNRVHTALSNLRNLGRVGDVDEMLRSQAELDYSGMDTSYSLVRGFVWAIPVLGFVGTVMGLSEAVGGFGSVLAQQAAPEQLAGSLRVVTSGLATAFETTLLALLFALVLQLLITFLHKGEEEFLDDCTEYCQRQLVSKLRLMPFEAELQSA